MPRPNDLQLGGYNDTVRLRLGGADLHMVESYEVKVSVLQQPAAFTVRLGWGKTAAELLKKYPPRTPFELMIGPCQMMSGLTYGRGQPDSNYTQIEFKGRDYLAALLDDEIQREYSFSSKTYFQLTRQILDVVGLTEQNPGDGSPTLFVLNDNNDNNREIFTRKPIKPAKRGELVVEIDTGATTGQGKVLYKSPKARTGTRWFDFLQDQYKLAGLFLWSTGSGNFVLARPRADMEACCRIQRRRSDILKQGDVIKASFEDDVTQRHASCLVYGRGGSGKDGRNPIQGWYTDTEMRAYGANNVRTIHDDDIKTTKEAEYIARRTLAEERRAGWRLSYTLSGHAYPSLSAKDGYGVWSPDTVVAVDDDELDIHGNFYVESVTYSRSPETTTRIELMRPQDLLFADALYDEPATGAGYSSGGKTKGSPKDPPLTDRQRAAEKFVSDNFGEQQGPPDLIAGFR